MKQKNSSKQNKFTKGFTLLELLVVVLIIGILAAIALPQYKKSVIKSKAAKMQTMLAALTQSMDRYYLEEGKYPSSFDKLDMNIGLPIINGQGKGIVCGADLISQSVIQGDDFQIALYDLGVNQKYMISTQFTKGKYKCRGFIHYFYGIRNGSTLCGEHYYDRACGTGCEPGIFCNDIMGMKKVTPSGDLMDLYK